MGLDDFPRNVGKKIALLGGTVMMLPSTGKRGDELGLNFFEFYVLGRAGVLGDVDGQKVADAFFFFNPDLVKGTWETAKQKMPPAEGAKHYLNTCADWGRENLGDIEDLDAFTELASRVADAAEPTSSCSLFAGWRAVELPDDAPGRAAAQVVLVLRELRGGLHVDAIKQVGLTPVEAVAANTPYMLQIFGWPADAPDTEPLEERVAQAEDLTDQHVAPAFSVLDDQEQETFSRVVHAIASKVGV